MSLYGKTGKEVSYFFLKLHFIQRREKQDVKIFKAYVLSFVARKGIYELLDPASMSENYWTADEAGCEFCQNDETNRLTRPGI